MPQHVPRTLCAGCGRPEVACYCAYVTKLPAQTRVLLLQHPREAGKAIGTARIAAQCLPSAQIAVGIDFQNDARVQALVTDPERQAMLLYPSKAALDVRSLKSCRPVTLVVLDGTWSQARNLKRDNPWLSALPQIAFRPDDPSQYRIRREPREGYVSTIEALALTLGALEGDPQRFSALLAPFLAMVKVQLDFAARSTGPRRRLRRQNAPAE